MNRSKSIRFEGSAWPFSDSVVAGRAPQFGSRVRAPFVTKTSFLAAKSAVGRELSFDPVDLKVYADAQITGGSQSGIGQLRPGGHAATNVCLGRNIGYTAHSLQNPRAQVPGTIELARRLSPFAPLRYDDVFLAHRPSLFLCTAY